MNKYRLALMSLLVFPLFLSAQKIDSMMSVYADSYPQEKSMCIPQSILETTGSEHTDLVQSFSSMLQLNG